MIAFIGKQKAKYNWWFFQQGKKPTTFISTIQVTIELLMTKGQRNDLTNTQEINLVNYQTDGFK